MQTLTTQLISDSLQAIAATTGIAMMAVAAVVGMVELPEHPRVKGIVNAQPVYVFATESRGVEQNAQRRERDESAPHYISYSAFQRTPGRTGRY